ncbi:hypothetical protein CDL12_19815 [Handroanthus impetiginosus]|uniref:Uncharacterized protein n=1 Tax=Handroanthus impetiginosus TaxID=429701 RepID=A0A2G9GQR9_9LAMI|nr:hypothetical protein CDL12_19815 [Handroanthus impetiginosus]
MKQRIPQRQKVSSFFDIGSGRHNTSMISGVTSRNFNSLKLFNFCNQIGFKSEHHTPTSVWRFGKKTCTCC